MSLREGKGREREQTSFILPLGPLVLSLSLSESAGASLSLYPSQLKVSESTGVTVSESGYPNQGIQVMSIRVRDIRVMGIRVMGIRVMGIRVTDIRVRRRAGLYIRALRVRISGAPRPGAVSGGEGRPGAVSGGEGRPGSATQTTSSLLGREESEKAA